MVEVSVYVYLGICFLTTIFSSWAMEQKVSVYEYAISNVKDTPQGRQKFLNLFSKNVGLDTPNEEGRTILFYALKWNLPFAREILKKNPDVNIQDNAGDTPLMAFVRYIQGAKYASESFDGMRIYIHDEDDKSEHCYDLRMIEMLIRFYDADASIRNYDGHTVFDVIDDSGLGAQIRDKIIESVKARHIIDNYLFNNNEWEPAQAKQQIESRNSKKNVSQQSMLGLGGKLPSLSNFSYEPSAIIKMRKFYDINTLDSNGNTALIEIIIKIRQMKEKKCMIEALLIAEKAPTFTDNPGDRNDEKISYLNNQHKTVENKINELNQILIALVKQGSRTDLKNSNNQTVWQVIDSGTYPEEIKSMLNSALVKADRSYVSEK